MAHLGDAFYELAYPVSPSLPPSLSPSLYPSPQYYSDDIPFSRSTLTSAILNFTFVGAGGREGGREGGKARVGRGEGLLRHRRVHSPPPPCLLD